MTQLAPRGAITTHILDTARGVPASGIAVSLERRDDGGDRYQFLAEGVTNRDGRLTDLLPADAPPPDPGVYRLTFLLEPYWASVGSGTAPFYPEVAVMFRFAAGETHYHVPLLLSPFGYSTYRGS